jgi:hypothetical protein
MRFNTFLAKFATIHEEAATRALHNLGLIYRSESSIMNFMEPITREALANVTDSNIFASTK